MGKPWATHAAEDGFDLMVYDIANEPVADLVKLGAKAAESPREVAVHADVLSVIVAGPEAVDAVLARPDGVLAGAHSRLSLVQQTTLHPPKMQDTAPTA